MRTITIVADDKGRTEVKILPDPESGRFFTKRDFDNALRATKKAYRQAIKEYRKKNVIKKFKEQKNDVKPEQNSGTAESGKESEKREEPGTNSIGAKERSFAGAADQALKRSGKLSFGKGS
jgi:hypothetical protein